MEILENSMEKSAQVADTAPVPDNAGLRTWHAPVLTVASIGEITRNDVNQLPYDFTNVRS